MKKLENKFEGQIFPMWFNFKVEVDHYILDIACINDVVVGTKINTMQHPMNYIEVTGILETRDRPRNGNINYFNPLAKFYTVTAKSIE